ncbi:hypothetical protein SUGI_0659330 [Cryptomeria japonica]|uniref:putative WEB family protein At1g65010, chloroplastic n=1 Tax=Cryptomeria japonica TaxID=3369 RepID=UPI002414B2F3|nr:putative WEB family protein At1g65010, chloroplastic [Cryptomeria japonica]GLJ32749.1 hypothetical protein SUGI_0659330 [Cryptomeria japonica]
MASVSSLSVRLGPVQFDRILKGNFQQGSLVPKQKCVWAFGLVSKKSRDKNLNACRQIGHSENSFGDVKLLLQSHTVDQQSDFGVSVEVLRKKEEELSASERALELHKQELSRIHNDLSRQEKKFADALALQAALQQELDRSKHDYDALVWELDGIKIALKERETEVFSAQEALASKEKDLEILRGEIQSKDDQLAQADLNFKLKDHLLNEANLIVSRQQGEITEMQLVLTKQENDLLRSLGKREEEEMKLKIAENMHEKRWVAWLVALQKMKEVAQEVCKHKGIALVGDEELQSVRDSLSAVKEELLRSQRSLEESRSRLSAQETQIEEQKQELLRQRNAILDYQQKLRHAHLEIENEREKLVVAEQENIVLQSDLWCEKEAVEELTAALQRDRTHLQQSIQAAEFLEKQLEEKSLALAETKTLLALNESKLVAVMLEMQKLKSELSSMQVMLEEKGNDLNSAQGYIEELHEEISWLKDQMRTKEDELLEATNLLQDKERKMNVMQLDMDNDKIRLSQAENMVENIANLTNTLVGSAAESRSLSMDEDSLQIQTNCDLFSLKRALIEKGLEIQRLLEKSEKDLEKYQQMKAEVEFVKGLLTDKEKELMGTQRALVVKDEELKSLVNRWECREKEVMKMREDVIQEANGLKELYATVQNKIGDKTLGELALEKLELDAVKLEAEAAMLALENLVDLSRKYLKETNELSLIERKMFENPTQLESTLPESLTADIVDMNHRVVEKDMAFNHTKQAVTDLTEMTNQLVVEAPEINSQDTQNKARAHCNGKQASKPSEKLVMAVA